MKHLISTTVINTPQGTAGSSDGVMMMFCKGVAVPGASTPLVLDTAYLCNSLSSLAKIGITSDYDYVNSLSVYQQASEFYAEAGDGAYLWLVVTSTSTAYNTYVAGTTFHNLIAGTMTADPAKRAKMIGLTFAPPTTQQSAADFPSEVLSTITALQTTQKSMFLEGYSWSGLVDGYNMSSTVTPSGIQTMANKSAYSISNCITGSKPNGVASIGAALGRFAAITIGHGFGEVDDGAISLTSAFLTNGVLVPILGATIAVGTALTVGHSYMVVNGPVTYNGISYSVGSTFTVVTGVTAFTGTSTTVVDLTTTGAVVAGTTYYVWFGPITYNGVSYSTGTTFTAVTGVTTFTGGIISLFLGTDATKLMPADVNALGESQYMFIRKWFNQSGLYWNDGATCDASNDPLSTQEFNRVANALSADAMDFCTLLMGKNVQIDSKTKLVSLAFTSAKEQDFVTKYIDPLVSSEDISSGTFTLTGTPNGANVVNWDYVLTINGTPITGSVTGTVQFN
jgi:hypothetical protein